MKRPAGKRNSSNTAKSATGSTAGRQAHRAADLPHLEPPDSEWPEHQWPDPAWPDFPPWGRPPAYAFTLAASPWFKEHYPDKAANLWDAVHVGRDSERSREPDRLPDREAGE